jgi:beta-lactamase superfamily II metal-dependent hydrolase
MAIFSPIYDAGTFPWPKNDQPIFTSQEIEGRIVASQPDALAAAAQKADNALNNQSLVVLFTFDGKTLLFSGDAQWGNWANFLFGGAIGTPGHTSLTARSKQILGKLDFYKVGHHGSTNATPMDVVDAMREGCVAMCSTDPGAYGKPERGTEVPREPLMAALAKKTQNQLARSDQVGTAAVPPTLGEPPLAAPFSAGPQASIEYYI